MASNDLRSPVPHCGNCKEFDGIYCMKMWNNLDRDQCVPQRDYREPEEYCDDYEWTGEEEDY